MTITPERAKTSADDIAGDRTTRIRKRLRLSGVFGHQIGLIAVMICIGTIATSQSSVFMDGSNLIEIARATAVYFIAACPATLILVGGGLDLSVGSSVPLGGVVAGALMLHGTPWTASIAIALAAGALLGLVNGALIAYARIPPFVVTLGTFFAAGGLVMATTKGVVLYNFPAAFDRLGQGAVFGIPYMIFYAVLLGVVFHVLLEKTRFGYNTRAIGGNSEAAVANGIGVSRVTILLYCGGGLFGALAGVLLAARLSSASSDTGGAAFGFQVITAAIIGGTSLSGGVGTIVGTALGALLFSVVNSALAVLRVDPLYQNIVVGVVLVLAVAIDQMRRRRDFVVRR